LEDKDCFGKKTIKRFLAELAKEAPTLPACGSALALTGALAASLEGFVTGLTLRHSKSPDANAQLTEVRLRLTTLQKECAKLMDQDLEEYTRVIQARKMPNSTKTQQDKRETALQEAKIAALGFPTDLIKYGLEMLHYSYMLLEEGHAPALADTAVAAEMAHATFRGALRIARANLEGISDLDFVAEHQRLLRELQTEGQNLYEKIQERLDERL